MLVFLRLMAEAEFMNPSTISFLPFSCSNVCRRKKLAVLPSLTLYSAFRLLMMFFRMLLGATTVNSINCVAVGSNSMVFGTSPALNSCFPYPMNDTRTASPFSRSMLNIPSSFVSAPLLSDTYTVAKGIGSPVSLSTTRAVAVCCALSSLLQSTSENNMQKKE